MVSQKNANLVITPATWPDQVSQLQKTATGLLDLVIWFGSTHQAALWRKAYEFLGVFRDRQVYGFDPQVNDWDPSYADLEAEAFATGAVVVIRLENHELQNGSLGSIAETGLALTSAALRGQLVVISIEDNLLASLTDPGAIAQYMMLELFLEQLEKIPEVARFFRVHRGDDLHALATLACDLAQQQREAAQANLSFDNFLKQRAKRKVNYPLRVLLGGSGGPYNEIHQPLFQKKKERLLASYQEAQQYKVKDLSSGAVADAWNIPYASDDGIGTALAMRTLLSIELEYKQDADLFLLAVMREAASKAAATSMGFSLLHALVTGQDVSIYLEPFDPVDYIYHQFKDIKFDENSDERSMREVLREAGVVDPILATAVQAEVAETFGIFKALAQTKTLTFRQIKKSLLGKTEAFHDADNIRRVRVLVEAHLDRLSADARFPDFFRYTKQII